MPSAVDVVLPCLDPADLALPWVLGRMPSWAAGWTVVQVDVPYRPRAGRSKVTGTPLGVVRAVHDMTRVLAR